MQIEQLKLNKKKRKKKTPLHRDQDLDETEGGIPVMTKLLTSCQRN